MSHFCRNLAKFWVRHKSLLPKTKRVISNDLVLITHVCSKRSITAPAGVTSWKIQFFADYCVAFLSWFQVQILFSIFSIQNSINKLEALLAWDKNHSHLHLFALRSESGVMSSQSNSPFGPPEDFLIATPTSELLITCSLIGLSSFARVFALATWYARNIEQI